MSSPVTAEQRCSKRQPCPLCGDTGGHCFFAGNGRGIICMDRDVRAAGSLTRNGGTYVPWETDRPPVIFPQSEPRLPPLQGEALHSVYRELLSRLHLQEAHRRHLLEARQLPEEWIRHRAYRSVPHTWKERVAVAEHLLTRFPRDLLRGVPGLGEKEDGTLYLRGREGLLIPMEGPQRQLRGAQIRSLDGTDPRYVWLSSPQARSGSPLHVAVPQQRDWEAVLLTEGPLKADYLAVALGVVALASAGVENWGPTLVQDLEYARSLYAYPEGVPVILAHDAADYGREETGELTPVARATRKLARRLNRYQPRIATWDGPGKGLDDYLREHPVGSRKLALWELSDWEAALPLATASRPRKE